MIFSFAAETPANENRSAASRRGFLLPARQVFFETPPLTAFQKDRFLFIQFTARFARDAKSAEGLIFSFAAETPANENRSAASRRGFLLPARQVFFETPPLTAFQKDRFLFIQFTARFARDAKSAEGLIFSFAAETPANENRSAASRRGFLLPARQVFFETPPLTAFQKDRFLCALCASAVSLFYYGATWTVPSSI